MSVTPEQPDREMTGADMARFLGMAAAYDQRTVGRADIDAWQQVALSAGWRPTYAARALIEHYTDSTDRVMPAHITTRIRARRDRYVKTYRRVDTPSHIHGVDAEVEWERQQIAEHITRCMDSWARGEDR